MRWEQGEKSENVEDRRRMGTAPMLAGGGGIGILLIALVVFLLGGNPQPILDMQKKAAQNQPQVNVDADPNPEEDKAADFSSVILKSTENIWREQFRRKGEQYKDPTLVLFRGQVQSACGFTSSAVGPFYCPADEKVYLDLSFFEEMRTKFRAPGDFAHAYVIAHEVGHHVQNQVGLSDKVSARQQRSSKEEANELSVRLELQADFLAGVWAHHAQKALKWLDRGDYEEAIRAAASIGDDKLQMQAQGYVVPESFTHGSSEQRVRWFRLGFETGDWDRYMETFERKEL